MSLRRINRDGVDLAVEERQLPRYQAEGWSITVDPPKGMAPSYERPTVNLIDVWRGGELRRCTVEQLVQMANLGFKIKEKANGGQLKHSVEPEDVRGKSGSDEPRKRIEGLFGGGSRSGSEVGLGGDSVSSSGQGAGLDDEQPEGEVTGKVVDRPSDDGEIREAFAKLDPANDEHWTKMGAPRLEVLNTFLEHGPVNRPQANAATDNAVRPTV